MKLKSTIAVSESGFIFDATSGESYSLNQTAMLILTMLKNGVNENDIKKSIMDEYEVEKVDFEKMYLDFIRTLHQYSFFEEAS